MNTKQTMKQQTICTIFKNDRNIRGEYTGYSYITGLHYVSLYNGDVYRNSRFDNIIFDTKTTKNQ